MSSPQLGPPLTSKSAAEADDRDRERMLRMIHGGRVILAEFYDLHGRRILDSCFSIKGDRQLVEAVLTEVFGQTWDQAATGLAPADSVGGWRMGIAHNLCQKQLRRLQAHSP